MLKIWGLQTLGSDADILQVTPLIFRTFLGRGANARWWVQKAITKCLEDGSAETRSLAREIFALFCDEYPDRRGDIMGEVGTRTRKLLGGPSVVRLEREVLGTLCKF